MDVQVDNKLLQVRSNENVNEEINSGEGIHWWDIKELELTGLGKQLNGSYVMSFPPSTDTL